MLLRIGSRGTNVIELQRMLGITADGIFGQQTHNAVVSYQKRHGLMVDGMVGGQTWGHLVSNSSQISQDIIKGSVASKSRAFTYGNARIIETTPDNIEMKVIRNTLRGSNSIGLSGSFFWPMSPASQQNANAIVVQDRNIIGHNASHAWRGFKQWVLCHYADGTFGVENVLSANEIRKPLKWAISGVSLLPNYNPPKEGFSGAYADVMRNVTSSQGGHTWIGVKDGKAYMYWRTNCNRDHTRHDAVSLGMEYCIGLDGGGSAQIKHPNLTDAHTSRVIHHCISIKQL